MYCCNEFLFKNKQSHYKLRKCALICERQLSTGLYYGGKQISIFAQFKILQVYHLHLVLVIALTAVLFHDGLRPQKKFWPGGLLILYITCQGLPGYNQQTLFSFSIWFHFVDLSRTSVSRVNLGDGDFTEYSFNIALVPFAEAMSKMLRLQNVEMASVRSIF